MKFHPVPRRRRSNKYELASACFRICLAEPRSWNSSYFFAFSVSVFYAYDIALLTLRRRPQCGQTCASTSIKCVCSRTRRLCGRYFVQRVCCNNRLHTKSVSVIFIFALPRNVRPQISRLIFRHVALITRNLLSFTVSTGSDFLQCTCVSVALFALIAYGISGAYSFLPVQ